MSEVKGKVGLKWPPKINDTGGLDLTNPTGGGWESLKQLIAIAHLPRMSSDPYVDSFGIGSPMEGFDTVQGTVPNKLKKYIFQFYSRMEFMKRAKLISGPNITLTDPATGKLEIKELVLNLQSSDTEEIVA